MQRRCEICSNFLAPARLDASRPRVDAHVFESRPVWLCATHSHIVRALRAGTLDEVRSLFRENGGRRSLLARRHLEGDASRRGSRSAGRRKTDRPSA